MVAVLDNPETPTTPTLFKFLHWCHRYFTPTGEILFSGLYCCAMEKMDFTTQTCWKLSETTHFASVRGKHNNKHLNYSKSRCTLNFSVPVCLVQRKSLQSKGYLATREKTRVCVALEAHTQQAPLSLTHEQQQAVSAITQHIDAFSVFLLEGITGSGKTEVYLQAMAPYLAAGKQVLVVVPELASHRKHYRAFNSVRRRCLSLHSGITTDNALILGFMSKWQARS